MDRVRLPVIILWLVCILSFFILPDSTFARVGQLAFWGLVVVHAIECLIYMPTIFKSKGSLPGHLFQTFIFGYFYFQEMKTRLEQEQGAGE